MKNVKLRLMTHNQWKNDENRPAWAEKGLDCSASVRVRGFARVYKDTMPDIVGCQEVSFDMADKLIRYCAEEGLRYALLWGRDTPILYRQDKFEVVDSDFSLYPDEFPGHDGIFNNDKTKSYNIGVFRIKENGRLFIYATTHLWWKSSNPDSHSYQPYSDEARAYQIGLLIDKVNAFKKKYGCPAFIVGDLNADYGSLAVQHALSSGYLHAHDIATEYADEAVGYHDCFGWGYNDYYSDKPFPKAIDHILLNGDGVKILRFERFSPEYYLPLSDHSPAFVDAEFI